MMNTSYVAEIEWLTKDAGGRKCPPPGPQYGAVVLFEDQSFEDWEKEAWDMVVELLEVRDAYHWKAQVAFRVEEAPQERLKPGVKFELYEGRVCAGRGVITGTAP